MRMIEPEPPSEQDLHAYIDGHLEPAEAARVAAYLARHPEAAALVEAYRAQTAGLHALYDKILDEPVPPELLVLLRRRRLAMTGRRIALAAAASAIRRPVMAKRRRRSRTSSSGGTGSSRILS